MEHFLLPHSGVGRKCSISSYGCGFPPCALHKEEHIHLQPGILLLPWPSCGLQPFTHLFVGDSIDLPQRITLTMTSPRMMNQKNRPRSNNGSSNQHPTPNPHNMGILSFSMSILSV